jgi:nucleoid-associated protein YgaU
MAPKKRTASVNRILLILAAVVLLPVLAVGAYFFYGYIKNRPDTGPARAAAAQTGDDRTFVPAPPTPQPDVKGATLKPRPIDGDVVETLVNQGQDGRYSVKPGDTLSAIAKRIYGDGTYVNDIMVANPSIVNENSIAVGQEIILPKRRGEGGNTSSERLKIAVVKPGETLIDVARREYGDSAMHEAIFNLNRDQLTSIDAALTPGLRLRLPPPPKY